MTAGVRTGLIGLLLIAGCSSQAGQRHGPDRAAASPTTTRQATLPGQPTATNEAGGPAVVATGFATAYLRSLPGEDPEVRAQRCRPFDTDKLDEQLSALTWSGAAARSPSGQVAAVTVTSLTTTSAAAGAVGYELAATVTVSTAGQPARPDQRALELWLVAAPGGEWRVDQLR